MFLHRLLVVLSLAALAGCDSATALRADLGISGDPPALDATLGGGPGAQTITFTAPAGGAFPDDWNRAQTIRVMLGNSQSPLARTPAGLVAGVPPTAQVTKPLDGKAIPMTFVIDGDHASVARVTFK